MGNTNMNMNTNKYKTNILALLILSVLSRSVWAQEAMEPQIFNCSQFNDQLQNDQSALDAVMEAHNKDEQFDLTCLTDTMANNLFSTNEYLLNNYFFKLPEKYGDQEILDHVQVGMARVNRGYARILDKIDEHLKRPILLSPPFQWAQSLDYIEMEIKYAYRHDVAGCADLFNETVAITKDIFKVGASCKELDQTMYFELKFKLWDEVDPETVTV